MKIGHDEKDEEFFGREMQLTEAGLREGFKVLQQQLNSHGTGAQVQRIQ
jgi:hypothetical protein